jgi:hypothetical protein
VSATNATDRWLDEIVSTWVNKIENEALLALWVTTIQARIVALRAARRLDKRTIIAGLASCTRGDRLYCDARIGGEMGGVMFDDRVLTTFEFVAWQPRARRLWVRPVSDRLTRRRAHAVQVSLSRAIELQISRTDPATRRRSPKHINQGDHA